MIVRKLLFFLFALYSTGSFAQKGSYVTGLGYLSPPNYLANNEINPLPLGMSFVPIIGYMSPKLRFFGPRISYQPTPGPKGFSFTLNTFGNRYESHEIEKSTAVNIGATYRFYFFSLGYQSDISGTYRGNITRFSLFYYRRIKKLTIIPTISFDFLNSNHNNYYFGVKENESTTYKAYSLRNAKNTAYTLRVLYQYDDKNSFSGILKNTQLDSAIGDSPLVAKRSYTQASFFWIYKLSQD